MLELLLPAIVEILAVKRIAVPQKARRRGEYLGIPRPAHAFVTLGTVRGHIDEVTLLSPLCVEDQAVHLILSRGELSGLRQG